MDRLSDSVMKLERIKMQRKLLDVSSRKDLSPRSKME